MSHISQDSPTSIVMKDCFAIPLILIVNFLKIFFKEHTTTAGLVVSLVVRIVELSDESQIQLDTLSWIVC